MSAGRRITRESSPTEPGLRSCLTAPRRPPGGGSSASSSDEQPTWRLAVIQTSFCRTDCLSGGCRSQALRQATGIWTVTCIAAGSDNVKLDRADPCHELAARSSTVPLHVPVLRADRLQSL